MHPNTTCTNNPFTSQKTMLLMRYRSNPDVGTHAYKWITLYGIDCKELSKVCHVPCDLGPCDDLCVHAIARWSKIKHHVLRNTPWLPKDLQLLIVGIVRQTEFFLVKGTRHYYNKLKGSFTMSFDEFIEFAATCAYYEATF